MKENKEKEKLAWRDYKNQLKKKKMDLLVQRLDREIEKKENDKVKSKVESKVKSKVEPKVIPEVEPKVELEVESEVESESEKEVIKEKKNSKKVLESNENERKSKKHKKDSSENQLEQLKEEFNKIDSKKKKKKVKTNVQVIDDEDNLDLKLDKTISIALPASIILNAQTAELKSYLIGQIARCAAIFNVNEIIVFDEFGTNGDYNDDETEDEKIVCVRQMSNVLKYIECPQYLRKTIFPLHKDFRLAGVINPLDTKHHLRFEDESEFREGVVNKTKNGKSFVYVGLQKEALINKEIEPGTRVTVKLDIFEERNYLNGKVVSSYLPTKKLNYYWGYEVRVAKSLSQAINECIYADKYDLIIGTSDKGDDLNKLKEVEDYKHVLIVFGGLKGIEFSMSNDEDIKKDEDPKKIFDYYLNTCPNQGTNTIRTEEAMLITLSNLSNILFT